MDVVGWITWFLHGILQSILLWAPIVEPLREDRVPHPWFEPCEIYEMWSYFLDDDSRPTAEFMDSYWDCIWAKFRGGIVDEYLAVLSRRLQAVWDRFGDLGDEHGTVAAWLWDLFFKIGEVLPDWAFDVAEGLTHLWELIPEPIRDGLITWAEFLAGVPEGIQEWIEEFIADLIAAVQEVWDWYVSIGQIVTDWWEWAYIQLEEMVEAPLGWLARNLGEAWSFLIEFWNDPAGAVIGWLSPLLGPLLTFATDCLDFWYNLWGSYAEDLAAFLADPLDFLWDRGEAYLNRKLEQP